MIRIDHAGGMMAKRVERLQAGLDDHPTLKALRSLADNRDAPFQHIGEEVRVGVPSPRDQPGQYYVNVGFHSRLRGRRIEIRSPGTGRSLTLVGRPALDSTDQVDLHLNTDQAAYLFGWVVGKTTQAIAIEYPLAGNARDNTGKDPPSKSTDEL